MMSHNHKSIEFDQGVFIENSKKNFDSYIEHLINSNSQNIKSPPSTVALQATPKEFNEILNSPDKSFEELHFKVIESGRLSENKSNSLKDYLKSKIFTLLKKKDNVKRNTI